MVDKRRFYGGGGPIWAVNVIDLLACLMISAILITISLVPWSPE